MMLKDEKILITGPASQVAFPIARALARENRVYGLARFTRPADRERIEALGVECVAADMADGALDHVPDDFTYVLNFAVARGIEPNFEYDLRANAEGAGRLLAHCRSARAFLHCSSGAVYESAGHQPIREDGPLGDSHRGMLPTYSLSKIAAESVVRFAARQYDVPTTIARFSVPYGPNGGWPLMHLEMMRAGRPIPVFPERPNIYNPIHEDDYVAHVPGMLEMATVPARVVNWGGSETVSLEEWCRYLGELTGLEATFKETRKTLPSLPLDLARMHEHLGLTKVSWRDGMRRLVELHAPELLKA